MHIGIDIRMVGRKRTGDESVFFNIVKNLALIDGENQYSLFIDGRSKEELSAIALALGIGDKSNFHIVSLPTANKFTWNMWTLPRYLRKYPVDAYHTQYIVPFFVSRKVKILTHIHDISFRVYPQYINWKDRVFLGLLIPRSLRRADRIIAVSEFTKREIIERYGIKESKVAVVLNAVSGDFASYEPIASERFAAVRKQYALPETFLLYVGTLQPRKNIPALIRAFALLHTKLPEMKLVIVGNRAGHNYDTQIDKALQESVVQEDVLFPGFVEQCDLPVIMRMARAFVFPSLYEGFGLPVLEAMSQRVPVVASDIPPLREIGEDGALFVDTRDLAKFSEVLYTISTVATVRDKLIDVGMQRSERFSWRVSAENMLMIYREMK